MVPTNELDSAVLLSQPRRAIDVLWGMQTVLTIATLNDSNDLRRELDRQYGELRATRYWDQARFQSLTQIPYLTPTNAKKLLGVSQSDQGRENGVLVRWQCMIQDTSVR